MKNYLMSSVALGLLFVSLPALAMQNLNDSASDELTDSSSVITIPTNVRMEAVPEMPVFPRDEFPSIVHSVGKLCPGYANADYSRAFYSYDHCTWSKEITSVKSAFLNLRGTCHALKNFIDPLFNTIPSSWTISPQTEALYPHLVSIIELNLNAFNPGNVEANCRLLSAPESSFKNLVSFKFLQRRTGPKDTLRELTATDINSVASVLHKRAQKVKYLTLEFPLTTEAVATLFDPQYLFENLEYLNVRLSSRMDAVASEKFIRTFPLLPGLKNICLEGGAIGEPECQAMISVLPKLPKLENFFLGNNQDNGRCPMSMYFTDIGQLQKRFQSLIVSKKTQKELKAAIAAHPNKNLRWFVRHPSK